MRKYNDDQYRKATIMGSFNKHYPIIRNIANYFKENGIEVIAPSITTIAKNDGEYAILKTDTSEDPVDLETEFLRKCIEADFVYVCNKDGYMGKTVMFELGYMLAKGQEVFFMEKPAEEKLIMEMVNKSFAPIVYTAEELVRMIKEHNKFPYVNFIGNDLFDRFNKPTPEFKFKDIEDEER